MELFEIFNDKYGLVSHTAFFIIPEPASKTDMDSGELIPILKTGTDPYYTPCFIPLVFLFRIR